MHSSLKPACIAADQESGVKIASRFQKHLRVTLYTLAKRRRCYYKSYSHTSEILPTHPQQPFLTLLHSLLAIPPSTPQLIPPA